MHNTSDLSCLPPEIQAEDLWSKEEALSRLGHNEALLKRISTLFVMHIDEKHQALKRALMNGSVKDTRFASHAIKGVAGDVGANALRQKASEFEQLAKLELLDEITSQMTSFEAILTLTVSAINK